MIVNPDQFSAMLAPQAVPQSGAGFTQSDSGQKWQLEMARASQAMASKGATVHDDIRTVPPSDAGTTISAGTNGPAGQAAPVSAGSPDTLPAKAAAPGPIRLQVQGSSLVGDTGIKQAGSPAPSHSVSKTGGLAAIAAPSPGHEEPSAAPAGVHAVAQTVPAGAGTLQPGQEVGVAGKAPTGHAANPLAHDSGNNAAGATGTAVPVDASRGNVEPHEPAAAGVGNAHSAKPGLARPSRPQHGAAMPGTSDRPGTSSHSGKTAGDLHQSVLNIVIAADGLIHRAQTLAGPAAQHGKSKSDDPDVTAIAEVSGTKEQPLPVPLAQHAAMPMHQALIGKPLPDAFLGSANQVGQNADPASAEPYPSRLMHTYQENGDVKVWIRDADLSGPQAYVIAQAIGGELSNAGYKLNSVMLNGKKVGALFEGNMYAETESPEQREGL